MPVVVVVVMVSWGDCGVACLAHVAVEGVYLRSSCLYESSFSQCLRACS